jgi:hypothetical protein
MNNDFRKFTCHFAAILALIATVAAFALWAPLGSEGEVYSGNLRVHDPPLFSLTAQKLRRFLIFAMLLLPVGLFLLCRGFNKRRRARASARWPKVTATILTQEKSGRYLANRDISCEYIVDGHSYRTGPDFPIDGADAERLLPGAHVDLRYDPGDPEVVVYRETDGQPDLIYGAVALAVLPLTLL